MPRQGCYINVIDTAGVRHRTGKRNARTFVYGRYERPVCQAPIRHRQVCVHDGDTDLHFFASVKVSMSTEGTLKPPRMQARFSTLAGYVRAVDATYSLFPFALSGVDGRLGNSVSAPLTPIRERFGRLIGGKLLRQRQRYNNPPSLCAARFIGSHHARQARNLEAERRAGTQKLARQLTRHARPHPSPQCEWPRRE